MDFGGDFNANIGFRWNKMWIKMIENCLYLHHSKVFNVLSSFLDQQALIVSSCLPFSASVHLSMNADLIRTLISSFLRRIGQFQNVYDGWMVVAVMLAYYHRKTMPGLYMAFGQRSWVRRAHDFVIVQPNSTLTHLNPLYWVHWNNFGWLFMQVLLQYLSFLSCVCVYVLSAHSETFPMFHLLVKPKNLSRLICICNRWLWCIFLESWVV